MKSPRLFEPEVPIPEDLREAVALWTAYKSEQFRFTYKPIALAALVKRMTAWGPERAMAAVEFSMAGGWEGLFEEKKSGKGGAAFGGPPESYLPYLTRDTIERWNYLDKHTQRTILENVAMERSRL